MNTPANTTQATVQTYLLFDGRCDEALDFYSKTLNAEVISVARFKDSPDPAMCAPGSGDKVMHAMFRIGNTILLASDGSCTGKPAFQGFSLSVTARDEAEAQKLFAAIGNGGQVQMPLTKTFFSPAFGMVADKFGLSWMLYVEPARG
jgi:PhnB protein